MEKILLAGSIAIDRIMNFSGQFADYIQPEKLNAISISVLLDNLKDSDGGVAGNLAYSLAMLGEQSILYGSAGKGSEMYLQKLLHAGVDISCVHRSHLPVSTFTVLTDQVNCQIGGFFVGAMGDSASLKIERFKNQSVFVVISPHDPQMMAYQVEECKRLKKRLFYDIRQQITNVDATDIKKGVEAAELLILDDYEFGIMMEKTGWSQEEIVSKVKVCVITMGAKGSQIFEHDSVDGKGKVKVKKTTVEPVLVEEMIDPTGVGDGFRAGFLYGYIRSWPTEKCAKLGSVVASYVLEAQGTQTHYFSPELVEQKYLHVYKEKLLLD